MWSQPEELARLAADVAPAADAAERIRGMEVLLVGIGTSWHAAHHGAWLLREAGVRANAAHAADLADYGWAPRAGEAVIVLSHTAGTGYSKTVLERARDGGATTVQVSGIGVGADLETVAAEKSYAYTVSHTGGADAPRAGGDAARRRPRRARRDPRRRRPRARSSRRRSPTCPRG